MLGGVAGGGEGEEMADREGVAERRGKRDRDGVVERE